MGKIIDTVVLVLYPVLVFAGLTTIGVRWTALLLLLLLGRRVIGLIIANRAGSRVILYQAIVMAAIMGIAAASRSPSHPALPAGTPPAPASFAPQKCGSWSS